MYGFYTSEEWKGFDDLADAITAAKEYFCEQHGKVRDIRGNNYFY